MKTYKISFIGRVHGVGFRFEAQALAQKQNIPGYVKNMPDGSVELVVQSSLEQAHDLIEQLKAVFARYILNYTIDELNTQEIFTDFKIKF